MKKRHKDTAWGAHMGGKNEIPPTPTPALERGKQAVGKIADILRQCYAFVISQAGNSRLEARLQCLFYARAPDYIELSQCCGMPSPIGTATFLQQCRSSRYVIDRVYSRVAFFELMQKESAQGARDRLLFFFSFLLFFSPYVVIYLIKTFWLKTLALLLLLSLNKKKK